MFLAFSVKMDKEQLALYKNEKRRENRSKVRQALLVSEYVFYKYFDIYQEAAELYNEINRIYPRKSDLRRTEEFRVWRNNVMGRPNIKKRKPPVDRPQYVFPVHPDIPLAQYIDPDASLVIMDHAETPQPKSPSHSDPDASLVIMDEAETPQPKSPSHSDPDASLVIMDEAETPQPKSPSHSDPDASLVIMDHPKTPQSESPNKKVMELKIPLMKPPTKTHPLATQEVPSVITQTLETVTEQVLEEYTADALEPSLYDEISPEIIDNIIQELRQLENILFW